MLEKQIEQDLKTALLAGERLKVDTLRSIKSAMLYLKVEKGKRESGLTEEEEIAIISKEAKKRAESAELYQQGGNEEKAKTELMEKAIIEKYLPEQLSGAQLKLIIKQTISELKAQDMSAMGQVILAVKQKTAGAANGSVIAGLVKESLS